MEGFAERLAAAGIELPEPMRAPEGIEFRFERVRLHDGLAHVSGHGPVDGERTLASGTVGAELDAGEAAAAARLAGLSMLASLEHELGDLDRIECWLSAFGMVRCAPGFDAMPRVVNGFSELILELWGPGAGAHARSAIGVAGLPFGWPVEVEAVIAVRA